MSSKMEQLKSEILRKEDINTSLLESRNTYEAELVDAKHKIVSLEAKLDEVNTAKKKISKDGTKIKKFSEHPQNTFEKNEEAKQSKTTLSKTRGVRVTSRQEEISKSIPTSKKNQARSNTRGHSTKPTSGKAGPKRASRKD